MNKATLSIVLIAAALAVAVVAAAAGFKPSANPSSPAAPASRIQALCGSQIC